MILALLDKLWQNKLISNAYALCWMTKIHWVRSWPFQEVLIESSKRSYVCMIKCGWIDHMKCPLLTLKYRNCRRLSSAETITPSWPLKLKSTSSVSRSPVMLTLKWAQAVFRTKHPHCEQMCLKGLWFTLYQSWAHMPSQSLLSAFFIVYCTECAILSADTFTHDLIMVSIVSLSSWKKELPSKQLRDRLYRLMESLSMTRLVMVLVTRDTTKVNFM